MSPPLQFYISEKQLFTNELAIVNRKLRTSGVIRLIFAGLLIFGIYYFYTITEVVIPLIVVGIMVFIFLVSKHSDLDRRRSKLKALIEINETEINALSGNSESLAAGREFEDDSHDYSYDIDLFGNGSFFQYLNRTVIASGKRLLANMLISNDTFEIVEKQEAIKELSGKSKWRQNFSATGSLVAVDIKASQILSWLTNHKSFVPKSMRLLPLLFSGVSLVVFILNYLNIIPLSVTTLWFFVGVGITGIYIKRINDFYLNASKAKETFKQYHQLLDLIEREEFTSRLLKSKQEEIKKESKKASEIFLQFSKMLDAFDQRNNMLVGVVANAFALRDLRLCYKIEAWIDTYEDQVAHWFDVISFFDAQNSLANFVFNHPENCFPEIVSSKFVIESKKLGHPLISKDKRVDNNFSIQGTDFFIITGANMAGKSTFLRTVSLSIIMANAGLPVCANSFRYSPIKLITSMRTSDSLTDDESYFFSELKRLKKIIESVQLTEKPGDYFIILDEILKGTNSTDKAIGSRKFVERLVKLGAMGIIATHDLSLCEISKDLSEVKNHYFDAEIIDNELYFDYTFKDGICKNMNASFLLKKMEII
ncbi:MAG: ABC-type multidrug transport system fused ATPase/permease subunit [Sediminicola sp.]|jgi:ABC-type multidrug transport system fused ATPase/permease subunit|tara:strand:+ start:475 stop:2256 length:1782 start_codon:yes stop_codon:yes gene_type:complete